MNTFDRSDAVEMREERMRLSETFPTIEIAAGGMALRRPDILVL